MVNKKVGPFHVCQKICSGPDQVMLIIINLSIWFLSVIGIFLLMAIKIFIIIRKKMSLYSYHEKHFFVNNFIIESFICFLKINEISAIG